MSQCSALCIPPSMGILTQHWQSPCFGMYSQGLEKFDGMLVLILGNVLLIAWTSQLYNTVLWMNPQALWWDHPWIHSAFLLPCVCESSPLSERDICQRLLSLLLDFWRVLLRSSFVFLAGVSVQAFGFLRPSVKSCKAPWISPCTSLCGSPSMIYTCHTSPPFYTHFSAYNLKLRQFSCHLHSEQGLS